MFVVPVLTRIVEQALFALFVGVDDDFFSTLTSEVAALTLAELEPVLASELSARRAATVLRGELAAIGQMAKVAGLSVSQTVR